MYTWPETIDRRNQSHAPLTLLLNQSAKPQPMLARGELRCIGATTLAEYKQFIEKDKALERR